MGDPFWKLMLAAYILGCVTWWFDDRTWGYALLLVAVGFAGIGLGVEDGTPLLIGFGAGTIIAAPTTAYMLKRRAEQQRRRADEQVTVVRHDMAGRYHVTRPRGEWEARGTLNEDDHTFHLHGDDGAQ